MTRQALSWLSLPRLPLVSPPGETDEAILNQQVGPLSPPSLPISRIEEIESVDVWMLDASGGRRHRPSRGIGETGGDGGDTGSQSNCFMSLAVSPFRAVSPCDSRPARPQAISSAARPSLASPPGSSPHGAPERSTQP
jgi:hypothetical protein